MTTELQLTDLPITKALRDRLRQPVLGDKRNRTQADLLAERLVKKAVMGDVRAAEVVLERVGLLSLVQKNETANEGDETATEESVKPDTDSAQMRFSFDHSGG